MNVLLVVYCIVMVVGMEARPTEFRKATNFLEGELSKNNGIIGVASVAGITSRNGRVSSVGGIKFFPSTNSANEYFYPIKYSNEKEYSYPITVSSEKDGKYASGTVQIKPGYVSASARAGFRPHGTEMGYDSSNSANKFTQYVPRASFNEFYFQPEPEPFLSRNLDNWFTKDFFQGFRPPAPEVMRNGWLINDFNPFINFWR